MSQQPTPTTSQGTLHAADGALGARPSDEAGSPAAEREMREAAAPAQPEPAAPGSAVVARSAAPAGPERDGVDSARAPRPAPTAKTPEAPEALPPAPEADSEMPRRLWETYREPPAPAEQLLLWQPAETRQAGAAGAQEAQQPAPGEASVEATSRLSALRNISFSLSRDINDVNQASEEAAKDQGAVAPEVEPQGPAESQRPVSSRVFVPFPQPAPAASAAPGDVMTVPELLPPKPAARSTGKRPARESEPGVRLDRRDADDEVAILPSWRGQYKRGRSQNNRKAD